MLTTLLTTAALASYKPMPQPVIRTASATSYCLLGTMADGSYTRTRSVAMNHHPLGTKIRLLGIYRNGRRVASTVRGLRLFVVRDRIGWGTELDFWSPSCSWSRYFGRKTVRYQIVR